MVSWLGMLALRLRVRSRSKARLQIILGVGMLLREGSIYEGAVLMIVRALYIILLRCSFLAMGGDYSESRKAHSRTKQP